MNSIMALSTFVPCDVIIHIASYVHMWLHVFLKFHDQLPFVVQGHQLGLNNLSVRWLRMFSFASKVRTLCTVSIRCKNYIEL